MCTATANKHGGRTMQLAALKRYITWVDPELPLTLPLLCFLVTPRRYVNAYRCQQQYMHGIRPAPEVANPTSVHSP